MNNQGGIMPEYRDQRDLSPAGQDRSGIPEDRPEILFIDKVLASRLQRPIRGVELFNIRLLGELAELRYGVTAFTHPTWHPLIRTQKGGHSVLLEKPPRSYRDTLPLTWITRAAKRRRADILLLGNVAKRLIPAMLLMRLSRAARRCVLIAHREPSRRSLWAQKIWPSTVIAVNHTIAGHFRRRGFTRVWVYYGITGADRFYPAPETRDDGGIDFCVIGNLDNDWKGADTATAAFKQLPRDLRDRWRLHLASFHQPPDFGERNIIPYSWMAADRIPGFLRNMDVMIVPSRDKGGMRETFSQAMVQGMLTGLPIIASRLPILTEKLDQGGGVIVDDAAGMAAAMVRLAGDRAERLRMGKAGRETARARYVWNTDVFARRYLQPL